MISGKNEKYWLYQNSKANCAFQITFPQNAENKNSTLTLEFIKMKNVNVHVKLG